MTATVIMLPPLPETRQRPAPCPPRGGLRFVSFVQMNEAQRRWAPAEAILPCPDCAGPAQVIAIAPASLPGKT